MFPATAACCVRACLDWNIIFVWQELMRFRRQKMKAFIPRWFVSISSISQNNQNFKAPGWCAWKNKTHFWMRKVLGGLVTFKVLFFHFSRILESSCRCFQMINIHYTSDVFPTRQQVVFTTYSCLCNKLASSSCQHALCESRFPWEQTMHVWSRFHVTAIMSRGWHPHH